VSIKLPNHLSTEMVILQHISRHIWLSTQDLFDILYIDYPHLLNREQFKVQIAHLNKRDLLESRDHIPGLAGNIKQWRLNALAATMQIAPRRGRHISYPRPKERKLAA